MIRLFFLITFLLMGSYWLRADQAPAVGDQNFMDELDSVKNPFEDGLPKPVPVAVVPLVQQPPMWHVNPPVVKLPPPPVVLPTLNLQGVMVGEEVHEAIIDDKIVSLQGTIQGARLISVNKQGVLLLYKGKKFFLKVE